MLVCVCVDEDEVDVNRPIRRLSPLALALWIICSPVAVTNGESIPDARELDESGRDNPGLRV